MPQLDLTLVAGEATFSVRQFSIHEEMSALFDLSVTALSRDEDLDLDAIAGKPATFSILPGLDHAHAHAAPQVWTGLSAHVEQVQAELTGLSTYVLRLVPVLWLATQRRNYRVFQHRSTPEIVALMLGEWGIDPVWKVDRSATPRHEYRVQYGETDYAFLCRLLEEAGIAFYFTHEESGSALVLTDQPHHGETRSAGPVAYVDAAGLAAEREHVTAVRIARDVRPGRVTLRDIDFRRRPEYPLSATASLDQEQACEQYHYLPGAFRVENSGRGDTPIADDRGAVRAEPKEGTARAERALQAETSMRRTVALRSTALDLWPGVVFSVEHHPRAELADGARLLATSTLLQGADDGTCTMEVRATFAAVPYRPPQHTPRPQVHSVQSAFVVGPKGSEIHTDEFGRVRVQFPWDREGGYDDRSSCWIRVSQGWAGAGFGMLAIPRVAEEVLVGFIEGNPDLPVIVGRVYNALSRVPYKLPENATQTGWKSDSSPGSEGYSELAFDDAKGRELVRFQAQRDLAKLVRQDEAEAVGRDQAIEIGRNRTTKIGAVDTLVVGEKQETTVAGSHTGAAMTSGAITQTTGGVTMTLSGGDMSVKANGNIALGAGGDLGLRAQGNVTVDAAGDIAIKAGGNLTIEAGGTITLKGADVVIQGGTVKIN